MTLRNDIEKLRDEWNDSPQRVGLDAYIAYGLERDKIIIDRADVPRTVQDLGNGQYRMDGSVQTVDEDLTAADAWQEGLEFLALALHLEARESEAAELIRRREELAQQYGYDTSYEHLSTMTQDLIKRLLHSEDEIARLKASA